MSLKRGSGTMRSLSAFSMKGQRNTKTSDSLWPLSTKTKGTSGFKIEKSKIKTKKYSSVSLRRRI